MRLRRQRLLACAALAAASAAFLPASVAFLIGGGYLPVQITNGLLLLISLLLQSTHLGLRLVDLVLHRRDGFPNVLFCSASYANYR